MHDSILSSVRDAVRAAQQLEQPKCLEFINASAKTLAEAFSRGNKVIIAGNGGSLCDASHFAEELTGLFRCYREALPAIALSDPAHITCTGNDLGFEWIFARGIEAYGKKDDVFVGLSTSGNSANIIKAFETAQKMGLTTLAFLGKTGGKLKGVADHELIIEDFTTSDRIQEAHMTAIHIIIEMVEYLMFPEQCLPSLNAKMKHQNV